MGTPVLGLLGLLGSATGRGRVPPGTVPPGAPATAPSGGVLVSPNGSHASMPALAATMRVGRSSARTERRLESAVACNEKG